jgi:ribosomal protein L11 methyltransferase
LRELSDAPESIAVTHFPPDPRDPKLFPRPTVIDIGTGSGILSEAAIRLGAGRVFAGDTDPEAVAVAKENFARAGVQVELFTGSADAVASGVADLIVANISPAWIAELAPEWLRILKPGGIAILSGFEAGDVPAIAAAVEKAGGRVRGRWGEREWAMLEIAAKPEHLS